MKSLLFLCLVGAAIYAALHITNPLPDSGSDVVAVEAQGPDPAGVRLSSWASDLGSLKPQVASEDRPYPRYYERKPRRKLPTMDEQAVAESSAEVKPALAASPKPKATRAASRKAKWRAESAQLERAVAAKPEFKRNRWQRRAERRSRKAFNNRAFLLGR